MEVTEAAPQASVAPLPGDDNRNQIKKKKKSFTLMKAAISLIRRKPNDKYKSKPQSPHPAPSNDVINTIVGSVRPLHLPDNQSLTSPKRDSSPSSASSIGENSSTYGSTTNLQDLEHRGGLSLSRYRTGSCPNLRDLAEGDNVRGLLVRKCPLSSFASAMSLLQLGSDSGSESDNEVDDDEDDDKPKAVENGGDEMIDSKADNFIAQFYSHVNDEG